MSPDYVEWPGCPCQRTPTRASHLLLFHVDRLHLLSGCCVRIKLQHLPLKAHIAKSWMLRAVRTAASSLSYPRLCQLTANRRRHSQPCGSLDFTWVHLCFPVSDMQRRKQRTPSLRGVGGWWGAERVIPWAASHARWAASVSEVAANTMAVCTPNL